MQTRLGEPRKYDRKMRVEVQDVVLWQHHYQDFAGDTGRDVRLEVSPAGNFLVQRYSGKILYEGDDIEKAVATFNDAR